MGYLDTSALKIIPNTQTVQKSLFSTVTERVKNALPSSSVLKVITPKKAQKRAAGDPVPEELAEVTNVFIGEFVNKNIKIQPPTEAPADYYRFGKASAKLVNGDTTTTVDLSAGDIGNISSRSILYEILPKTLDDFEDVPASIRLVGTVGTSNKEQDLVPPFTKFILESVQESESERSQVVETFGEFFAFFYGKRPSTYTFTGTLLNTRNVNWLSDWMFYYENFLRGTKAVEQNARIILTYQGRQIEGFIMNTSNSTQAATDRGVQMNFQVLVTKRSVLSLSTDFGITLVNGQLVENSTIFKKAFDGFSRREVSEAVNSASDALNKKDNSSKSEKKTSNVLDDVKDKFKTPGIVATNTGGLKQLVSGLF